MLDTSFSEDSYLCGILLLSLNSLLFASLISLYIYVGSPDAVREFFWSLYSFIYLLGTYLKPHVSHLYFLIIDSATNRQSRCRMIP